MWEFVIEYLELAIKLLTIYIFVCAMINFGLNSYFERKKKLISEYLKAGSEALNKIVEKKKENENG